MRIGLSLILLLLTACNYNHVKNKNTGGNTGLKGEKVANPDYATVKSILGPKCEGCHNPNRAEGKTELETFEKARLRGTRIVVRAGELRNMPPGQPLSELEISVLKNWVDNGAPEKINIDQKPGDDVNKGPTNWNKIKKILEAKCIVCHRPGKAEGTVDLSEVKLVRAKIFDVLRTIVGDGNGKGPSMPLAPYDLITPAERRILYNWIDLEMPE